MTHDWNRGSSNNLVCLGNRVIWDILYRRFPGSSTGTLGPSCPTFLSRLANVTQYRRTFTGPVTTKADGLRYQPSSTVESSSQPPSSSVGMWNQGSTSLRSQQWIVSTESRVSMKVCLLPLAYDKTQQWGSVGWGSMLGAYLAKFFFRGPTCITETWNLKFLGWQRKKTSKHFFSAP